MKKIFSVFLVLSLLTSLFFVKSISVQAADESAPAATITPPESGVMPGFVGTLSDMLSGHSIEAGETPVDPYLQDCSSTIPNLYSYLKTCPKDEAGQAYSPGILGTQAKILAVLFDNQISSKEYVADLLDNMGLPTVSRAYAQGTGYAAMSPFLPFWKVFRNLAYSLYIIMFIVVGIMIMLRTKVNAQTIITIQSALPNLLITLILITFSYAIVGFMIDLMYFLIYLAVYLVGSTGIFDSSKMITRLMSYSAWSVIFAGRNSIISAVAVSIQGVLSGLGTGAIGVLGATAAFLSRATIMYLIVAVAFAIAMLKLMFALIKSYVMVIVQTVTAPMQILMNALPGSKAFGDWLKKTASYLIPFPVVAVMFIFSAILVGNPTDATLLKDLDPRDANPFGIDQSAEIYQNRDKIWLPPFTLTDSFIRKVDIAGADILTLIGFFVFLMTPAAVKMAQDWLQVKESPYTAEAFANLKGGFAPVEGGIGMVKHKIQMEEQRKIYAGITKSTTDPMSGARKG